MLSSAGFVAMGTDNVVVVENPGDLRAALRIVEEEIRAIDATCSRFREDSELSRLNRSAGAGLIPVSPLLEEALLAALGAAQMTGGLVDPTVGKALAEAGYAVTFSAIVDPRSPADLAIEAVPGWRSLVYDPATHAFALPAGTCIDLGASGKAWAADRAALAVTSQLGIAVAVACGGDVAVSGPRLEGGWPVRISAGDALSGWQDVTIFDGGLATSGTTSRRWRRGGVEMHHIIDPATGQPAETPWEMVTVAAATCLEANAAATAALILGDDAIEWLDLLGLPARLVGRGGDLYHAGGWVA